MTVEIISDMFNMWMVVLALLDMLALEANAPDNNTLNQEEFLSHVSSLWAHFHCSIKSCTEMETKQP